jgi:hypothetical protein
MEAVSDGPEESCTATHPKNKRYQCLPELSYFVLRQWASGRRVSSDFTERAEKVTEIEQVELSRRGRGQEKLSAECAAGWGQ